MNINICTSSSITLIPTIHQSQIQCKFERPSIDLIFQARMTSYYDNDFDINDFKEQFEEQLESIEINLDILPIVVLENKSDVELLDW